MSDVSLKDHMDARIEWVERNFATQIESLDRAVKLAADSLEYRLHGMNEFRNVLKDQAAKLATREEISAHAQLIDERIKSLEVSRGYAAGVGAVAGVLGGGVMAVIVKIIS